MKAYAIKSSADPVCLYYLWIGEGAPSENFSCHEWQGVEGFCDFSNAQKHSLEVKSILNKQCYIVDISVEEMLTHRDEEIRKWAIKQIEKE